MAEQIDLDVALLNPEIDVDPETPLERAADWREHGPAGDGFRTLKLRTACLMVRGSRLYMLRQSAQSMARDYDVIVVCGWESPVYWQFLWAARAQHIPVIAFYESTLDSSRVKSGPVDWVRKFYLRQVDGVVVPGCAAGRSVRRKGARRIWEGFNAVDVKEFHTASGELPPARNKLLYVGVLTRRKNVDSIIRALASGSLDLTLTIVGSGPEEFRLRSLASELGVANRITWRGYVPYRELPALMKSHACLLLVSHVEVWGLVVNEALAAGLHVIVSRSCGVCESVEGMPGVITCEKTPASIATALAKLADTYQGVIDSPPILLHSPRALAEVFLTAVEDVLPKNSCHTGGRNAR